MKIKTITELRDQLIEDREAMRSGKMDIKLGSELANVAGKILKTAAIELSYNQFTKQSDKRIPFLQGE